jgi:spore coat polysaccharide biosynthesis protein SpsF
MTLGKIGIIVAARTNSSRLPGKALLPLCGMPMILFLLERLKGLRQAQTVFATTQLASDDRLADTVAAAGVPVFRGSANDLVARYSAAAAKFGFDTVGRVTGDCPFVNAEMVDNCLDQAATFDGFDLATTKGAFPVGLDIEMYPAFVMARLNAQTDLTENHREHLTLYMYENKNAFNVRSLRPPIAWPTSGRSFTVDTSSDYEQAAELVENFGDPSFSIQKLIERTAA